MDYREARVLEDKIERHTRRGSKTELWDLEIRRGTWGDYCIVVKSGCLTRSDVILLSEIEEIEYVEALGDEIYIR